MSEREYPGPTGLACPACARPATHGVWFGLDFYLPDARPRSPDWYGCEAHAATKAVEKRAATNLFEEEPPEVRELDDDDLRLILGGPDA